MKYSKPREKEIKDWLSQRLCCDKCERSEPLTLDHVVPVHFLLSVGATQDELWDWSNFAGLCRPCNTFKAGRIDVSDKRTKPLMIKYINRYCV